MLRDKLWDIDPGFLRLQQAIKTITAILLALSLCMMSSPKAQILAGIGAGFAIQGIKAPTLKTKLLYLLIFNSFYCLSFLLGLYLKPYPYLLAISFTLLAFFCFYVRRFGPQFAFPGLLLWTFFMLAHILPFQSTAEGLQNFHGFVIGLLSAAFIYLGLFPSREDLLFVASFNQFLARLNEGLILIQQSFPKKLTKKQFKERFVTQKLQLLRMTSFTKSLVDSTSYPDTTGRACQLAITQFALLKALTMIFEAYQQLSMSAQPISKDIENGINHDLSQTITLISHLKLSSSLHLISSHSLQEVQSERLTHYLCQEQLINSPNFIYLLNFSLGLQLLVKNITSHTRALS